MSTGGAASRRVSLGEAMLQTPKPDSKATNSRAMRKTDKMHQFEQQSYLDDTASCLSSGSLFKLNFWLYFCGCTLLA
jgi:protein regulator of cytokinesis 1